MTYIATHLNVFFCCVVFAKYLFTNPGIFPEYSNLSRHTKDKREASFLEKTSTFYF